VLSHRAHQSEAGRTLVQHRTDLFLYTDSKAAALVARLMGPSAPRMAEQCAGQIEMFFSALAWYLDQHPAKAEALLTGVLPPGAPRMGGAAPAGQAAPARRQRPSGHASPRGRVRPASTGRPPVQPSPRYVTTIPSCSPASIAITASTARR
jgi:hypothetical protein